jgi:hypothetical protein
MNLRPSNIPPQLHHLIPLAEKYGIADDRTREDLIGTCSQNQRRSLKEAVQECDDEFDLWLSGPEAAGPEYTNEYIAFSALRMAADFA